jgi:hypothetical protein
MNSKQRSPAPVELNAGRIKPPKQRAEVTQTHMCMSTLAERGWTPALVKRHLGAPDKTAMNPHYRYSAPMKLYSVQRVLKAERSKSWTADLAHTAKRKAAAMRGRARRKAKAEVPRVASEFAEVKAERKGNQTLRRAIAGKKRPADQLSKPVIAASAGSAAVAAVRLAAPETWSARVQLP